jgi:hypothetical protein
MIRQESRDRRANVGDLFASSTNSVQWTQRDGLIERCLRIATEILMKGGARTKRRYGKWISANFV